MSNLPNSTGDSDQLRKSVEAHVKGLWGMAITVANKRDEEYLAFKDANIADITDSLLHLLYQHEARTTQLATVEARIEELHGVQLGNDSADIRYQYDDGARITLLERERQLLTELRSVRDALDGKK